MCCLHGGLNSRLVCAELPYRLESAWDLVSVPLLVPASQRCWFLMFNLSRVAKWRSSGKHDNILDQNFGGLCGSGTPESPGVYAAAH